MSRTIRRSEKHLLKRWLGSEFIVAYTSKHPWKQQLLPGLLYCKVEPEIIRQVQSDAHGFFKGVEGYTRKRIQRKFRQRSKLKIQKMIHYDNCEGYLEPVRYFPWMWN